MQIFNSSEDAYLSDVMDSVHAATKAGFTKQAVDSVHVFCQKPDTIELVDIFPDGSWSYQNPTNKKTESMTGDSAAILAIYLHTIAEDAMKKNFLLNPTKWLLQLLY